MTNCDGTVLAHARPNGAYLWGAESNDDGQATPGITADDTVVYTPFYSPRSPVAYAGPSGDEVDVPVEGVRTTYTGFDPPDEEVLPAGYSYGPMGLTYQETLIWPGGAPDVTGIGPYVHRQAGVTVISDFETGLRVVADDGEVLLAPAMGDRRMVTNSPVWDVGHDQAAVASADGVFYLLDLRSGLTDLS